MKTFFKNNIEKYSYYIFISLKNITIHVFYKNANEHQYYI